MKRVVCIILFLALAGIACGEAAQAPTQITTTPTTQAATAKPTQAPAMPAIGKPWKVDDTWTVTVNSAKTNHGDSFIAPAAGHIFVVVDVTLKNTSTNNQAVSSLIMFSLKDATGQAYDPAFLSGTKAPDGTVRAGSLLRGQLAYDVPIAQHTFTFDFQPGLSSSELVEWTVKI